MDIQVLGNRVLITRDDAEASSKGGITLPKKSRRQSESGYVLRAGPGEQLGCGVWKEPGVEPGQHVLFTNSNHEPIMLDGRECAFIDGTHLFAYQTDDVPILEYNGYEMRFDYVALRDMMFILPALPPTMLGKKSMINIPHGQQKNYHDGTGMILSAGPGYIHKNKKHGDLRSVQKEGKFKPTDSRLKPGVIVNFDIKVPWNIYVNDTEGNSHYVCVCGAADIRGLL